MARSHVAVAVVQAGSWSSNLTLGLGTAMCRGCGPKKKKKKQISNRKTSFSSFPQELHYLYIPQIPDVLQAIGSQGTVEKNPEKPESVCLAVTVKHTQVQTPPPAPSRGPSARDCFRFKREKMQLRRQRMEGEGEGPLNIQCSAQILFLHSPPAHTGFFFFFPLFSRMNSQKKPTLNFYSFYSKPPILPKSRGQGISNRSWPSRYSNPG